MEYKKRPLESRFWPKVNRAENGCWEWAGNRNADNYGRFYSTRSGYVLAHRFMWELVFGLIPAGLLVCHRCDNPPCCNPFHLFTGTHRDNNLDAISKGRLHIVTPHSRLLDNQILEIVRLYESGVSRLVIAEQFGVSKSYPWLLANGLSRASTTGRTRVKQTGP